MEELEKVHRIKRLFSQERDKILSVYFTAGYPQLDDTMAIVRNLSKAGADMIEIGMPYSDPVADGPTIQQSNQQALENGMSVKLLMEQLKPLREYTDIPVILMGYANPVIQYGVEQFCKDCADRGIDGLIIPDLPMQEYLDHYHNLFQQYGLHNVFLITPQTSEERIRWIDSHSDSFIYAVADASITGSVKDISNQQQSYFKKLQDMKLIHPFLIGFGIYNHETFNLASEFASGAIIGSAFIKVLRGVSDLESVVNQFVQSIKNNQ